MNASSLPSLEARLPPFAFPHPCLAHSSNAAKNKYRIAIDHQDFPKKMPRVGDGSVKVLLVFGKVHTVVCGGLTEGNFGITTPSTAKKFIVKYVKS